MIFQGSRQEAAKPGNIVKTSIPGFIHIGKKMFAFRGRYLPFIIRYAIRRLLSYKSA
jgi:hypothetical protein